MIICQSCQPIRDWGQHGGRPQTYSLSCAFALDQITHFAVQLQRDGLESIAQISLLRIHPLLDFELLSFTRLDGSLRSPMQRALVHAVSVISYLDHFRQRSQRLRWEQEMYGLTLMKPKSVLFLHYGFGSS